MLLYVCFLQPTISRSSSKKPNLPPPLSSLPALAHQHRNHGRYNHHFGQTRGPGLFTAAYSLFHGNRDNSFLQRSCHVLGQLKTISASWGAEDNGSLQCSLLQWLDCVLSHWRPDNQRHLHGNSQRCQRVHFLFALWNGSRPLFPLYGGFIQLRTVFDMFLLWRATGLANYHLYTAYRQYPLLSAQYTKLQKLISRLASNSASAFCVFLIHYHELWQIVHHAFHY